MANTVCSLPIKSQFSCFQENCDLVDRDRLTRKIQMQLSFGTTWRCNFDRRYSSLIYNPSCLILSYYDATSLYVYTTRCRGNSSCIGPSIYPDTVRYKTCLCSCISPRKQASLQHLLILVLLLTYEIAFPNALLPKKLVYLFNFPMFVFFLLAGVISARVFDLPGIPKGWEHVGQASPDEPIQLRLALRQQGESALEAAVLDRSTPGTADYGVHLSREELQYYLAPSEVTETSVTHWLSDKNVPHSIEVDRVTIRTTVDVANNVFNASFGWFRREGGGAESVDRQHELKLRSLSYSIPDHLTQHIDTVQPVARFGDVKAMGSAISTAVEFVNATSNSTESVRGNCDSYETPGCLKQLLHGSFESETAYGRIGFASFLGQSARYGDLAEFISELAPGLNFSFTEINGGVHLEDHDTTPSSA